MCTRNEMNVNEIHTHAHTQLSSRRAQYERFMGHHSALAEWHSHYKYNETVNKSHFFLSFHLNKFQEGFSIQHFPLVALEIVRWFGRWFMFRNWFWASRRWQISCRQKWHSTEKVRSGEGPASEIRNILPMWIWMRGKWNSSAQVSRSLVSTAINRLCPNIKCALLSRDASLFIKLQSKNDDVPLKYSARKAPKNSMNLLCVRNL